MEQKHTPEPWRVSGNGTMRFIDAPVGNGMAQEVASCMRVEYGDMEANARRIVACVNVCRGLSTDELERFGLASAFGTKLVELENQRDQLMAALETIASSRLLPSNGDPNVLRDYAIHAIATINEQQ